MILGTEGGTYYVGEKKLTIENGENVVKCINSDGKRVVDTVVEISKGGKSANNDAAIFVLALCASCNDPETRKFALSQLNEVCRIGTHLFHFVDYVKAMRGFGRGLCSALAKWYTDKDIDTLTYQLLKYKQRDGWSHRDVLRLAHPKPKTPEVSTLFKHVTTGTALPDVTDYAKGANLITKPDLTQEQQAEIIKKYRLTREVIPTELLSRDYIQEALLEHMPLGALIRNLGNHARLGLHTPFSETASVTYNKITNEVLLKKARIHPLAIANAFLTYNAGKGLRGNHRWEPNSDIRDALSTAFFKSFNYVKPTGKKIMLALDVSGSMTAKLSNSFMSCIQASAVLAKVSLVTEKNTTLVGFTAGKQPTYSRGGNEGIMPLTMPRGRNLISIFDCFRGMDFTRTDCSLPMLYCMENNIDVDAIVIYTDSETWAGKMHPWQALDKYQDKVGHTVKLIVVGMVSNSFTIARPDYDNMLDIVGFSTDTPALISNFINDFK